MSRRSLRLEEGLLDRSLPHSSASFSVGGASWRSNKRLMKPHRSQHLLSSSCSESLLLNTPGKAGPICGGRGLPTALLGSSVTSDASLLSSLLDESSVQDTTLVDTFWESTGVEDQSALDSDVLKHRSVTTYRSSSSTIYCRDRSLKSKTGVRWLRWVVCALTHAWQVCGALLSQTENPPAARSGLCGVMDLKGSPVDLKELHPGGSLRGAGQEKQPSSWSSLASCLWSAVVLTASCLSLMTRAAASAVWPPTRKLCSASWSAAGDVFRRLPKRRRHMTSSFLLTGFPLRMLLVFLPLLLLFLSWCWFGSVVVSSEMGTAVSVVLSVQSRPAEGAGEESEEVLPPAGPPAAEEEEALLRLGRLEESQAELWVHVEAGGRRAEQRHAELLGRYTELRQLVSGQNHRDQARPWIRDLLDQEVGNRWQTEKDSLQQRQETRLDQLELDLQALTARTQEVQRRQEAAPSSLPAAVGGTVTPPSHDALLADMARLEVALEDVRRGVQGLSGALERIQQTVSARVREEVRVLVYGNQLTMGGGSPGDVGGAPESLLQWLSLRYVSGADLQAALDSLELSILKNLSLEQEEQEEQEEQVLHGGVTQEDVRGIVRNALRLFSQDRTGLADFALESGGGSVLRCSESHRAKVALYSLFGVPLWYFSQSPRAAIQPNVQPGNCWAFSGASGVLVLRLAARIRPTAFSLEHLPPALAPTGESLSSAPRDFSVYGLQDEAQEGGRLLGSFTYDQAGDALQTFGVLEDRGAFQFIELQVSSNWGHQEYTCLYRFRAHGTPQQEEQPDEKELGEEPDEELEEELDEEEPDEELGEEPDEGLGEEPDEVEEVSV